MSESKAVPSGKVLPIHAKADEIVEIHWHLSGHVYVERRTMPPKNTVQARKDLK